MDRPNLSSDRAALADELAWKLRLAAAARPGRPAAHPSRIDMLRACAVVVLAPELDARNARAADARAAATSTVLRHAGDVDRWFTGGMLAVFGSCELAFDAARILQRRGARSDWRIALCLADYAVAQFDCDGEAGWTLVGTGAATVEALARVAPAGAIALDAGSLAQLERRLAHTRAVVTREFPEGERERIHFAPVPAPSAPHSTFAGLGWSH